MPQIKSRGQWRSNSLTLPGTLASSRFLTLLSTSIRTNETGSTLPPLQDIMLIYAQLGN